jgi:hypothetical protein
LKRLHVRHLLGNVFGQFNKILHSFISLNLSITPGKVFKRRQQSTRTIWRCSARPMLSLATPPTCKHMQ